MLNLHVRPVLARVLTPVGRGLARTGISPDVITIVGTLGVVVGAFVFYPRGQLLIGTLVITAFVFSDVLDGALARARGRSSQWGAFLDSTLDRIGDASIFGALVLWFSAGGQAPMLAALALFCLIAGTVVSYAKARAEGLGLTCDVGIAERSERLIVILVSTGLAGLDVPYALTVGLWVLAVASAITVVQRVFEVHRQTRGTRRGGTEQSRPKAGHRP